MMKKVLSVFLCAMLLFIPFSSLFASALSNEPLDGEPLSFVVLGDSISQGHGASEMETSAYAPLVAAKKGYELNNFAIGGSRSYDLLKLVLGKEELREAVRGADIINISIGGNDFLLGGMGENNPLITGEGEFEGNSQFLEFVGDALRGDFAFADPILEKTYEDFAATIAEIRALNPDATIIVQTLYNPVSAIPLLGKAYDTLVKRLNDCFYNYLEENQGAYQIADVYTAFQGRSAMISSDGIHPSDNGHAIIAEVLIDTIDGNEPMGAGEMNIFQKTIEMFRMLFQFMKMFFLFI